MVLITKIIIKQVTSNKLAVNHVRWWRIWRLIIKFACLLTEKITFTITDMENIHELLVRRHSIRKYTSEPIAAEDVKLILEAGLLAPTSKSSRSWQFIAVDDRAMLDRLAQCKPAGALPLSRCPLAIVVAGSPELSDPWVEDASIAAAYMQLQAEDLGIGSCWIQVRGRFTADGIPSEEYVQELLGIPETLPVLCIMTFGHKDEERRPVDTSKLCWEKVHIGRWNPAVD